jgi:hypothetical protein
MVKEAATFGSFKSYCIGDRTFRVLKVSQKELGKSLFYEIYEFNQDGNMKLLEIRNNFADTDLLKL